jgi:hypothetical protein
MEKASARETAVAWGLGWEGALVRASGGASAAEWVLATEAV